MNHANDLARSDLDGEAQYDLGGAPPRQREPRVRPRVEYAHFYLQHRELAFNVAPGE